MRVQSTAYITWSIILKIVTLSVIIAKWHTFVDYELSADATSRLYGWDMGKCAMLYRRLAVLKIVTNGKLHYAQRHASPAVKRQISRELYLAIYFIISKVMECEDVTERCFQCYCQITLLNVLIIYISACCWFRCPPRHRNELQTPKCD